MSDKENPDIRHGVSYSLPHSLHQQMADMAQDEDASRSAVVERLIRLGLEAEAKEKK